MGEDRVLGCGESLIGSSHFTVGQTMKEVLVWLQNAKNVNVSQGDLDDYENLQ